SVASNQLQSNTGNISITGSSATGVNVVVNSGVTVKGVNVSLTSLSTNGNSITQNGTIQATTLNATQGGELLMSTSSAFCSASIGTNTFTNLNVQASTISIPSGMNLSATTLGLTSTSAGANAITQNGGITATNLNIAEAGTLT